MASVAVASPAQGASSRRDVNANAAAVGTPNSSQSLKSALARSVTGTLAFYLCARSLFREPRDCRWFSAQQLMLVDLSHIANDQSSSSGRSGYQLGQPLSRLLRARATRASARPSSAASSASRA